MSTQETEHRGKKVLSVAMLTLLVLLSATNLKIVQEPLEKLIRHDLSFEGYVDEVKQGYLSDSFTFKNDFVNLNGLFARLTGRRTLNNVVKLNNGMLSMAEREKDMTVLANSITSFSDYLSEQNIPFLYIQMPYKESLDGQSFPVGVISYANRNADDLLSQLSSANVETLDLRPLVSQTPEMLEQYFYKTDLHWNSDAAFIGVQEVLDYLNELFPYGNIDLTYAHADQWERHSIDDWFLGGSGKRVGIFFGGTDPLIWYTPKFETKISCVIPKHGLFYRGDFTEANIRSQYINEKDYFGYNAYCVYTGNNYPLVQFRNLNAPSSLKVIMIQDSFTLPLRAHLSTVFKEIDVIDPREFSECTIAEYVEHAEPDIVILAINPSLFGNATYQNFGVKETGPVRADENSYELVARQDIEVELSDNNQNYSAYPLEINTVYRVAFDGVDILDGQIDGVGLQLYNKTTEAVLGNTIFDLAYCEATDSFNWIFRTPDTQDELELLFYAGIYGSTTGNSVIYRDVTVEKLPNCNS